MSSAMPNGEAALLIRGRRQLLTPHIRDGSLVISAIGGEYEFAVESMRARDELFSLLSKGVTLESSAHLTFREKLIVRAVARQLLALGLLEYVVEENHEEVITIQTRRWLTRSAVSAHPRSGCAYLPSQCTLFIHQLEGVDILAPQHDVEVHIAPTYVSRLANILSRRAKMKDIDKFVLRLLCYLDVLEPSRRSERSSDWMDLPRSISEFLHFVSRPPHVGLPIGGTSELLTDSREIHINADPDFDPKLLQEWYQGRRSERRSSCHGLKIESLSSFFHPLLVGVHENDGARRIFPSAGGFYDYEFFVIANKIIGAKTNIYKIAPGSKFGNILYSEFPCSASEIAFALDEVGASWGIPGTYPDALVFVTINYERLSRKYGTRSYRLALLNGGVLFGVMYDLTWRLGLCGCAIGYGSQTLQNVVVRTLPGHSILVEYALSASN